MLEGGSTQYFSDCPGPPICPVILSDIFIKDTNTSSMDYAHSPEDPITSRSLAYAL